ncbi:MAG: DNA-directed RNA polymerase subunit K [Candidatus Woesearchaeota archaeon]
MTDEITDYTKYEIARILGSRALQISMGAPILIKLEEQDLEKIRYNPIEIAKLEFSKGVIPITVRRPFPKVKENVPT